MLHSQLKAIGSESDSIVALTSDQVAAGQQNPVFISPSRYLDDGSGSYKLHDPLDSAAKITTVGLPSGGLTTYGHVYNEIIGGNHVAIQSYGAMQGPEAVLVLNVSLGQEYGNGQLNQGPPAPITGEIRGTIDSSLGSHLRFGPQGSGYSGTDAPGSTTTSNPEVDTIVGALTGFLQSVWNALNRAIGRFGDFFDNTIIAPYEGDSQAILPVGSTAADWTSNPANSAIASHSQISSPAIPASPANYHIGS